MRVLFKEAYFYFSTDKISSKVEHQMGLVCACRMVGGNRSFGLVSRHSFFNLTMVIVSGFGNKADSNNTTQHRSGAGLGNLLTEMLW